MSLDCLSGLAPDPVVHTNAARFSRLNLMHNDRPLAVSDQAYSVRWRMYER